MQPIVYNIFTSFMIAAVSFYLALLIYKNKGESVFLKKILLFLFWLAAGIIFFNYGLRNTLIVANLVQYDLVLARISLLGSGVQIFSAGVLVFWALDVSRIWLKKIIYMVAFYACLQSLIALVLSGAQDVKSFISEWGISVVPPRLYSIIFGLGAAIIFVAFVIYFVKVLYLYVRFKRINSDIFFSLAAIWVYGVSASLDNMGFDVGWIVLFLRSLVLIGVLLSYLAYTWRQQRQAPSIFQV